MKINFYGKELNAYKSALHTHCTVSDGDLTPDEVIKVYQQANYDVLAFSDHHKANPVSSYDGRGMCLLSGIELHPKGPRDVIWHLLALGVPEDFPGTYASAQEAIDAVRAVNGIIFCAHPNGYFSSYDILQLHGLSGIEVANTNGRFIGRESNETVWNELIAEGWHCPALGVDDMHSACDFFGNWTVIAAENKEPATILQALADGNFYATQGPEFTHLSWKNGVFEAEFTEVVEAFVYGYPGLDIIATPGFPTPDNAPKLTSLSCRPTENFRGVLRCRIRDAANRCAWSAPISFKTEDVQ